MAKEKPFVELSAPTRVPLKTLGDLLSCAFEGGSNYWYRIEEFGQPPKFTYYTETDDEVGRDAAPDDSKNNRDPNGKFIYRYLDYPLNPEGFLIVSDCQEAGSKNMRIGRVDLSTMTHALRLMATQYPWHWADLVAGNMDADTGDVFLQLCVFSEVIYG